ncbi:hypothetical protein JKP88DRAFT_266544 [Tribonema minus]|uniref:Uncharacterized protein n=1 Tax=Tribonema minus TaxID=303371 RepID=A0A835ZE97_9STRA|nr:hypothetical protein JKP88DRAFT_266544 [Tribonema minus]
MGNLFSRSIPTCDQQMSAAPLRVVDNRPCKRARRTPPRATAFDALHVLSVADDHLSAECIEVLECTRDVEDVVVTYNSYDHDVTSTCGLSLAAAIDLEVEKWQERLRRERPYYPDAIIDHQPGAVVFKNESTARVELNIEDENPVSAVPRPQQGREEALHQQIQLLMAERDASKAAAEAAHHALEQQRADKSAAAALHAAGRQLSSAGAHCPQAPQQEPGAEPAHDGPEDGFFLQDGYRPYLQLSMPDPISRYYAVQGGLYQQAQEALAALVPGYRLYACSSCSSDMLNLVCNTGVHLGGNKRRYASGCTAPRGANERRAGDRRIRC